MAAFLGTLARAPDTAVAGDTYFDSTLVAMRYYDGVHGWRTFAGGSVGGAGGSFFRFGTTAPVNSLGADGDVYLNTTTGALSQKASGAYVVVATLTLA